MSDQGLTAERNTGYAASASTEVAVSLHPKLKASRYPVLASHMYASTADVCKQIIGGVNYGRPIQELTRAGYHVVSADYGGAGHFGNDNSIARHVDGHVYAVALGANDSRIGVVSYSMGTFVLNWVRLHLDKVKACALILPAPGMDALRNTAWSTGSLTAIIDAAHPPNWTGQSAAYKLAHDPQRFAAELRDGPYIRLFVDNNDPFKLESPMYADFMNAVGGSRIDMVTFNGGGHTIANLDPYAPRDFLMEHL